MKAIIIGAGRGRRLMPYTANLPKCFTEVAGRRILDWALEAFRRAGIEDIVFIGGYCIDQVRAAYPELVYRNNTQWERNNILASLFCAEDCMDEGFVCSYSDILFRPSLVTRALEHSGPIVLGVDTEWRQRYVDRSQHPEDDAEKVRGEDDRVTEVRRTVPAGEAQGEYIGVARFTREGATALREHYARALERCGEDTPFRDGRPFRKAYLIELFQEMIEQGADLRMVETRGDYMEVDTQEDYDLARAQWEA